MSSLIFCYRDDYFNRDQEESVDRDETTKAEEKKRNSTKTGQQRPNARLCYVIADGLFDRFQRLADREALRIVDIHIV